MGFCGVTSRAQVPQFWKDVEVTKSKDDLHGVVKTYFREFVNDLDLVWYRIYWSEVLLEAIRKVKLTASDRATFLMSELAFSLLALMPYTREEVALMEEEAQLRKDTKHTLTYTDAKKAKKQPRFPPGHMEEVLTLFTMYSLVLRVMFGGPNKNAHAFGLNLVRGQLKSMAASSTSSRPCTSQT